MRQPPTGGRAAKRALRAARSALGMILAGGLLVVPASGADAASGRAVVDRRITDARITESSGLTPSLLHPGVVWTHNDSGNPPRIYAIGTHGRTAATLTLRGEPDIDWEAITSLRGPAGGIAPGAALIAVGDIGDNRAVRPSVRVAIVREPAILRTTSITPIRDLRLRYPGGPRDAETLLSDPRTGQLYVVSKALFGSTLYSVPLSVWPGGGDGTSRLATMTKVADLSASFVTDGAFLPDGRILLRGYGAAYVIERPDAVHTRRLDTLASMSLPSQEQGESIAVTEGGRRALIGSEGRRSPVLRITVPPAPGGQGGQDGAGPSPTLPSGSAAAPGPATSSDPAAALAERRLFAGVRGPAAWAGMTGGLLVLLMLVFAVVRFWPRRGA
jgi:hypothetical protein